MVSWKKCMAFMLPCFIFGLDGLLKHRIDRTMEEHESREIAGGKLTLRKTYNPGAAFHLFAKRPKLLTAGQGVLLFGIAAVYAAVWKKEGRVCQKLGFGMLLGGGMSNFYDRLKKGYVVDYVSFPVPWKWLRKIVFNISDFFILAGALLVAVSEDK